MRTLVVWCPDWPVVAAGSWAGPAAVLASGRVVACSDAAREAGVRRGQRLRDAQRCCPGLAVRTRDLGTEARAFEPVVAAVEGFCPRVEIVRPGMCAIGTRGPARYFGGEHALASQIAGAVTGLGYACRTGVADGLFAAQLAARTVSASRASRASRGGHGGHGLAPGGEGPGGEDPGGEDPGGEDPGGGPDAGLVVPPGGTPRFLAPHPVRVLAQPELTGLLERLGVHTLGQFAALPSRDVLTRFGAAGVTAHRLSSGLEPRPLAVRPPSADLSARTGFDPPAELSEPVVFAAKALAERMHAGLAAQGLTCVQAEIQVRLADGRELSRLWRHDGLLSSLAMAERVRWQLDCWKTQREPVLTAGITVLRLVPGQLVPDEGHQLGLWGEAVASDRVARAAGRVQAMLGHEAVTQPVLTGGRDPAGRVELVPFGDTAGSPGSDAAAGRPWPGRIPAPAPATVYPSPLPARVTDASGAPVTVTGRGTVSAAPAVLMVAGLAGEAETGPELQITAWAGPWPMGERWWDRAKACAALGSS
jgi:protein ImuB